MAFVTKSGGTAASFDEAVKTACEDRYEDAKMTREKREMKKPGMEHQHPK